MPDRGWITCSFPTHVIFRYHLPLRNQHRYEICRRNIKTSTFLGWSRERLMCRTLMFGQLKLRTGWSEECTVHSAPRSLCWWQAEPGRKVKQYGRILFRSGRTFPKRGRAFLCVLAGNLRCGLATVTHHPSHNAFQPNMVARNCVKAPPPFA